MLKYKLQYRRQSILYSLILYLIIRVGFLFIIASFFPFFKPAEHPEYPGPVSKVSKQY